MYCETPPEKPVCRCKDCVLREPDNIPWIDVLSLNMAEQNNGIFRRVSNKTSRSMESVISGEREPRRNSDQKGKLKAENITPIEAGSPSELFPEDYIRQMPIQPPPPPPPPPTIVVIMVNKPELPSPTRKCDPGCSGSEPPMSTRRCDPVCQALEPPPPPRACYPGCPGSEPPPPPRVCYPGCPGSEPPPPPRVCYPGCPGSEQPPPPRVCYPACPGLQPPPAPRICFPECPSSEPPPPPIRCFPGCSGSEPSPPSRRCYPWPPASESCPEPREYPGPRSEYPCAEPRGYSNPGPEYICPELRGYPCPGLEYSCLEPRGYPCPNYSSPGRRCYPGPRPVYSCPAARRPPCPGPAYPCPAARGPPAPGPKRCPGSCGSPNRRYNASPCPGRRSRNDERCRYDGNRSCRNRCQESPRRQSKGYADSSRNSQTIPRSCRCSRPKTDEPIKSESTSDSSENISPASQRVKKKKKPVRRISSYSSFQSARIKPVENPLEQNRSDSSFESIESKTFSNQPEIIKSIERLAGSGNYKNITSENEQKSAQGSRRSSMSIKSQTQRNSQKNYWQCENKEVVVTDNTNKTFKCIQVPICISVGNPTKCRDYKCEKCQNFDCYSMVGPTCEEDEDKCSCSSNEKRSCSLNEKCSFSSEATSGFNCPATDCFVLPAPDCCICPNPDINDSPSKGSLNSQSISSCECSCDSFDKCSSNTEVMPDITSLAQGQEQDESEQLACNLSNLEATLRCLVPNADCICYLKKKNRSKRRRKKRCPKACDRFAHPPHMYYPKPKCLDYGISPYRKVCFNPCCCAPIGMTTYNLDYCCKGRSGGY